MPLSEERWLDWQSILRNSAPWGARRQRTLYAMDTYVKDLEDIAKYLLELHYLEPQEPTLFRRCRAVLGVDPPECQQATTNGVDAGRARCGVCGAEMEIVRPGKWQCVTCLTHREEFPDVLSP